MDLSILIPVYNWDVTLLLGKILDEINGVTFEGRVEVIVMDDCSTKQEILQDNEHFINGNEATFLRYTRLHQNRGRSSIRNLLAEQARGKFLLFLDCDVLPDSGRFIGKYLEWIERDDYDVVCGGRSYLTRSLLEKEYDYYEYFGRKKEVKSATKRNDAPWRYILTSNVMLRKSVYQAVPFNEKFVGYGYEDIEWGIRLSRHWKILHIDNTASHLGLVSKTTAFEKMRESIPNYLLLRKLHPTAFSVAAVGRLARILSFLPVKGLAILDHIFAWLFLNKSGTGLTAFIMFQLDYSVLLAAGLKKEKQQ